MNGEPLAPLGRDGHRERDQVQPALHGFVHVADRGLVVARDHQLELGIKLEKVLSHKSCTDLVAASQRLNFAFCPASSFLGFGGCH